MLDTTLPALRDAVRAAAHPLTGAATDYDPLLDLIGDARVVLIGEASHGTHEFYQMRAQITMRLIAERGFRAVAVEADWPDAERVNRYVNLSGSDRSADAALKGFNRFPEWMWRNRDVLAFVDWLRTHNSGLPEDGPRVGIYGLDLYSLHGSIAAVLNYLDKVDPEAAGRARERYSCFEQYVDPQTYGYMASLGDESCAEETVAQLLELQQHTSELTQRDGPMSQEAFFSAQQNARLVKDAEQYYRAMFAGRASSWNLRDTHMADTLDALLAHLDRQGEQGKAVVWAHNSHLGDARATEMSRRGELNVGQLVRERYGDAAVLVGFSTYSGSVTAASDWGAPGERKQVRPALPGSYEELFHEVGLPQFLLPLRAGPAAEGLRRERLERAIGVIYRPDTERASHYFHASLTRQFDAIIHIDQTRAVEPLEPTPSWQQHDLPETFPSTL